MLSSFLDAQDKTTFIQKLFDYVCITLLAELCNLSGVAGCMKNQNT